MSKPSIQTLKNDENSKYRTGTKKNLRSAVPLNCSLRKNLKGFNLLPSQCIFWYLWESFSAALVSLTWSNVSSSHLILVMTWKNT